MSFADEYGSTIVKSYRAGKSTYEIASELGTYSNKIIRVLDKLNEPRRSLGEAQRTALETGRATHPTEGKVMSEEARHNLSESVSRVWEQMSAEERNRRSEMSRKQWNAMSAAEQQDMRSKASAAVRLAGKEGSKLEKYVLKGLRKLGWEVNFHVTNTLGNTQLEIDMMVPGLNTAIEIDGPSHFLPIWGEAKLAKHQLSDARKSGLLLAAGAVLIRVKQITKTLSLKKQEDTVRKIDEALQKIKKKFPPRNKRLIEIEI